MGGLAPCSRMSTARLIATVVLSVSAAVVLAALMPADALAAGCTDSWARAESGPWSTPANWSTGSVPTSSDEVCITTSGEYTVTLTGSVSIKTLTLGASSGPKQTLLLGGPLSSGNLNIATAATISKTGVLNLESTPGNDAVLGGSATISNSGELLSSASNTNYLEANLTTTAGGIVDLKSGELRQDDNTTTTNEGALQIAASATLAATAGDDLIVNKSSVANGGTIALSSGASWTQEAGSAEQSGSPVALFGGVLTDVSGGGTFDLIDSTTLSGTIPAGQTVVADAIPGHNASIAISGTVTNHGTLALLSPAGGGEAIVHGTQLNNLGVLSADSESANANYLEVGLTTGAGGVLDVEGGELRQDDNTITTNEGTFSIAVGAEFQATAGDDLIVNKSSLANSGKLELDSGASWIQESGSTQQSGNAVTLFGGALTDVSGAESFDLIDSTTLSGTIPAGQTVTADAIHGHNSSIAISGTVTNDGTLALLSPAGGGEAIVYASSGSSQLDNDALLTADSQSTSTNFLQVNLTNVGTLDVEGGELRQDDNTTTTNEGAFEVGAGAEFQATAGDDLIVNKGSVANGGKLELHSGASWTQQAGSAEQTGSPVEMFSGALTDVSGGGTFDLIDSPSLSGTVPKGQTVVADAIPGHNASIAIPATVLNEGTIALVSPVGGGDAIVHGTQLNNLGVLSADSESANPSYLEVGLTTGAGGVLDVEGGELRQDDNTTTTNEGAFEVGAGAEFQATTGDDLIVNKSSLANSGKLELSSGASWTQEAGSAEQSGSPVALFGGVLTDVSGGGTFDLIDSTSLSGAIPAGQTVVADAIPGHNSSIDLTGASGEVVNEGTFVLDDPSSGIATVDGVELVNKGITEAQTAAPTDTTYLEANLTNAADGTVEVKSGELRQDDNTTTTNEGTLQISASATLALTTGGDVLVNNGKLEPDLASATSFGIVNISGGATFHPGGTLLPNLLGGYAPPVGTEFNVITSSGAIAGTFAKVENNFEGDYSKADIIAVKRERDSTAVALATKPNPSTYGQPVTLTATITAGQGPVGSPTGMVTFFDGATALGAGEVSTTAGVTTADFTTSALAAGHHEIVATYDGDPNYGTSSSAPGEVTVVAVPPAITTIEPASGPTGGGGGGEPKAQISTNPTTVPPPLLAKTGNVAPVAGTVLVQLPGTSKSVPLSTLQQVPFGSVIEATNGTVSVTTARSGGGTQTGEFFSGEFILRQGPNGLVIAELTGGNFSVCPTKQERSHIARAGVVPARAGTTLAQAAVASGSHVVRKLWANAHGKFSTKGNYAAGAVQGTEWLTEDLCDGTLIKVTRDKVAVTNLVNHKHVEVTTGHHYLAKAP